MEKLLDDFKNSRLSTPDLIQQLALLAWLNDMPESKDILKTVTTLRVGQELFHRFSNQSQTDMLQALTITTIADYIKSHPHASQNEIAAKVQEEVQLFVQRLNAL